MKTFKVTQLNRKQWAKCLYGVKIKDTDVSRLQEEAKGRNLFACPTSENCSDTGRIELLKYQEGNINRFLTFYRVPLTQRISWTMTPDSLIFSPT